MNKKFNVRELILAGLAIAIGILLPMLFHALGLGGPVFLPMHIPVIIFGAFLSPVLALLVGMLTPLLSALITGMPIIFPIAPIMILELGIYGLVMSLLLYKKKDVKITKFIISLLIAMVAGRVAAGIAVFLLVNLAGAKLPANPLIFIKGAIITGLPGLIIQIIIMPLLYMGIRRLPFNKQ